MRIHLPCRPSLRFLFVALSVAAGSVAAQLPAPDFERVVGGPAYDRGVHVTTTRDGGFAAIGVTISSGKGGEDVLLVRTAAAGETLWSKTYGGEGLDNGWAVQELEDGFVLAGFTQSFGAGGYDVYLVRTDTEGEELWSRTYGGEGDERCWGLTLADDGGFVLVGETDSSGAGERDGLLIKTDAAGEELWSRTFGGERDDRCFAVTLADDGGFVLAGQTFSEGAGDRDAWVVRTDAEGELQWSRTFGGAASDVAHFVSRTADGMFLVTGYTTSLATAGDDPYLIKIDPDGDTEWVRVLAIPGTTHTITGDQAADGGYFCVGFSTPLGARAGDALLIKVDAEGQLEWRRSFFTETEGESAGYTVRATADGGCVFTGHTTAEGDSDLFLIKVAGEDAAVTDDPSPADVEGEDEDDGQGA